MMEFNKSSNVINNSLANETKQTELVVITVWYNRPDHVNPSISSLLNQTAEDYTIFAVDDGSTDDTGDKLKEMLSLAENNNVPMKLWQKNNEGFVTSLKKSIEEQTTNKIIALHGAGDISKPDRLRTQLNMLQENKTVIATGVSVEKMNSNGEVINIKNATRDPVMDPFMGNVPRLGTHGASMYYRDKYDAAGGYREHFYYAQDADLFLRLRKYGRFMNTHEKLYSKLVSNKTISSGTNWEKKYKQIIYSAAALESARCRELNKKDPIDSIEPNDWLSIKKIAKQNGLEHRAIRRFGSLLETCIVNKNVKGIIAVANYIGIYGLLYLLTLSPQYVYNRIKN